MGEQSLPGQQPQAWQSVAQEVERGRREGQGWSQMERQTDGVGEELLVGLLKVVTRVTGVEFIRRDLGSLLLDSDRRLGLILLQILLLLLIDQTRNREGFPLRLLCLRGEGWWAGRRRRSLTGRWCWKNSSGS